MVCISRQPTTPSSWSTDFPRLYPSLCHLAVDVTSQNSVPCFLSLTPCPVLLCPESSNQRRADGRKSSLANSKHHWKICRRDTEKWEIAKGRLLLCAEWQQNDTVQNGWRYWKLGGKHLASFLREMKTHYWDPWGKSAQDANFKASGLERGVFFSYHTSQAFGNYLLLFGGYLL